VSGFLNWLFGRGGGAQPRRRPERRGPELGPQELARRLRMSLRELEGVRPTYRSFQIPKRSGGRRTILVPDDRLKSLQRRILRRVLARLKSHPAATGFERGHSIVTNALPHVGKDVVIRMDLKDFFGSTSAERVNEYFICIGWSEEAAKLLTRLVTHEGALPQGAPTSPRLSNLVNGRLDARLEGFAQKRGVSYSRYADDIVFSGAASGKEGRINDLIHAAKMIVADEGYVVHVHKKLRISRRHDRQMVTGLMVNEKVNLPREVRRRLRAVEHHLKTGKEATLTAQQLAGWKALQSMIVTQSATE